MKITSISFVKMLAVSVLLLAGTVRSYSQQVLTLQQCRDLALENNKESAIAREKVNAAGYDRKSARANYFPKVSVTAGYLHNGDNIELLPEDVAYGLNTMGTSAQTSFDAFTNRLLANPVFQEILKNSPHFRQIFEAFAATDLATPLNAAGHSVTDMLSFDIQNVYAGAVTVEEPIYVGGKIRAYNKVTAYAEELAASQLETEDRKIQVTTDEAYWQIVSVAWKLKLADQYLDLLRRLESDVEIMKNEGVATQADLLSVKVKLNEAEMAHLKAENGLVLAKMLLCQLCGLDLYSDIVLADEQTANFDAPVERLTYTANDIDANRPELKSLQLAAKMYDEKAKIVRADFLPSVAVMGNYILTNPNVKHSFSNKMAGTWNVGVVARIPVYHFGEGMNKYRRAKSDALIAKYQLDEVREKITLQVTQNEQKVIESEARLRTARKNLDSANENLRLSNLAFKEGVLESSLVMAAQTAWAQASSEEIDARIDCLLADVYLRQATGLWNN